MKLTTWILSALLSVFLFAAPAHADMDVEITINWTPPTQNTDGTPITDLAGYTVYYGDSSRSYSNQYDIGNPAQTTDTFTVLNINSGTTIYVTMTAEDATGNVSTYSNEVSFGPFLESDVTAPNSAGGLSGSARIVRCGSGLTCSVN